MRGDEHVICVADAPAYGILHRNHAEISLALFHRVENLLYGIVSNELTALPEPLHGGDVRERGFRPQIADFYGLLRIARDAEDFAENELQPFIWERPLVRALEAGDDFVLAHGVVDAFALALLLRAYFHAEPYPLVQQFDYARIHAVDSFPRLFA